MRELGGGRSGGLRPQATGLGDDDLAANRHVESLVIDLSYPIRAEGPQRTEMRPSYRGNEGGQDATAHWAICMRNACSDYLPGDGDGSITDGCRRGSDDPALLACCDLL